MNYVSNGRTIVALIVLAIAVVAVCYWEQIVSFLVEYFWPGVAAVIIMALANEKGEFSNGDFIGVFIFVEVAWIFYKSRRKSR